MKLKLSPIFEILLIKSFCLKNLGLRLCIDMEYFDPIYFSILLYCMRLLSKVSYTPSCALSISRFSKQCILAFKFKSVSSHHFRRVGINYMSYLCNKLVHCGHNCSNQKR